MSKPFDAVTKDLVEGYPEAWATLAGVYPDGGIEVVDADLSTVSTAADKLLHILGPPESMLHFELQASLDGSLELRCLKYNVLAVDRHGVPVLTVLVLLRPAANSPEFNGIFQYHLRSGEPYLEFRYRVIRVWELPVEEVLNAGLGVLPLATISNVDEAELPGVIERMKERIDREASPGEKSRIWTSSFLLTGLKYKKDKLFDLFKGVVEMEESSGYQIILDRGVEKGLQQGRQEGEVKGARSMLIKLGSRPLGAVDTQVALALEEITDLATIEFLAEHVGDVNSWQELLGLVHGTNGKAAAT